MCTAAANSERQICDFYLTYGIIAGQHVFYFPITHVFLFKYEEN